MLLFNMLKKSVTFVITACILAFLSGCQVTPLYGTNGSEQNLAELIISDAKDRNEQITRNHLIFLLGTGQAANPSYKLDLNVTETATGVLDSGTGGNFTAGRMTMTGSYTLSNLSTNEVIAQKQRRAVALYDQPDQEFSKIRALKDARERAAKELAELIRADITPLLRN